MLVFSDEKDFTVDQFHDRRNDRYIAKSTKHAAPQLKYMGTGKHPSKASMLGVIMSDGSALPPFWYEGSMDSKKYKKYLQYKVLLMLDATYGKDGYIWTQDGAPAHCCNNIEKYLGSEGFWPKLIWPPSSPNLNPSDFSIWMLIKERACATPSPSVDVLKARVKAEWVKLSKHCIRDCCGAFCCRLEVCLEAEAGVFEK